MANEDDYGEDEENDFSLVVRLTHGDVRFLFAGDAENARLAELLDEGDLASDVLKVPHHGRYARPERRLLRRRLSRSTPSSPAMKTTPKTPKPSAPSKPPARKCCSPARAR